MPKLDKKPLKVVSLLSSNTEIVYALGAGSWLVGRSHECDFPNEVHSLPVCSTTRIDASQSSRDIDTQVKNALRNGLSLYEVDRDMLQKMKPDVVLTQAQCEVCAVSLQDVESCLQRDLSIPVKVVSVSPQNLNEILESIKVIGNALGLETQAENLVSNLQKRIEKVREGSQALQINTGQHKPKIFCMEWIDPLMAAGNWVPEMVEIAGGIPIGGEAGKHSPWFEWEQLKIADPDLIIVCPCGFDVPRTQQELNVLDSNPVWKSLRAVKGNRVHVVDGNQFFNRPGPRIVDSLEILSNLIREIQH